MQAEEYIALPYTIGIVEDIDEDGRRGWVAEIEELPGCISQGETPEEAAANVRDAMLGWISVAMEDGQHIPQPATRWRGGEVATGGRRGRRSGGTSAPPTTG
jgi:predicted RNase H-like HicB family nuclease